MADPEKGAVPEAARQRLVSESASLIIPQSGTHPTLNPATSYLQLDPEKIINRYGKYGTYQMIICAMSNVGCLIYAMETMIMSLIAAEVDFDCISTNPSYTVKDHCTVLSRSGQEAKCGQIPNTTFLYHTEKSTLITEFGLVCDKGFWAQHGTSIFMIGGLMSTPIVTQLADRYGRRLTFLIPLWITVLSNIASGLAPNYHLFLFCRWVSGLGTAGIGTVAYVIQIETVTASFRTMSPLISTFVWVSGYMGVGVLYMLTGDWRTAYLAMSLPGLATVAFYWMMPESLHWSISNQKTKAVKKYVTRACKINKKEILLHECRSSAKLEDVDEKATQRTILDVLKFTPLMIHLVLHCYIMMVMNGTYWALSLFSVDLHEDQMVGYFLSGFVELPAGFISIAMLGIFGRRTVTSIALFGQTMCMMLAVVVPGKGYISMSFPLLAKVFNSIAWTSEPLLISEMSPTSVRNVFHGFTGFIGEIASVFAPYLNSMKAINEHAPSIMIGVMSVLAAIAVLLTPETRGKSLPEDLRDFDPGSFYRWITQCGRRRKSTPTASEEIVESLENPAEKPLTTEETQ